MCHGWRRINHNTPLLSVQQEKGDCQNFGCTKLDYAIPPREDLVKMQPFSLLPLIEG